MEFKTRRMIEVTPALAKHYLARNNYPAQRELRQRHVDDLAEKILNGDFRFGEVAFGQLHEKVFMVNGQHICNAVIKTGTDIPCVMEEFSCANELELSNLFRQFEILGRSLHDMVAAEALALGLSWQKAVASLVVAAACLREVKTDRMGPASGIGVGGSKLRAMNKEQKVKLLRNYLKEGEFINKILTGVHGEKESSIKRSRHLRRAPITYVMMESYNINEKASKVFWTEVRDGELLTSDMPQFKLRDFLMSVNSMMSRKESSYRRVQNHEYIVRSIHAWNAFMNGQPTKLTYRPEKGIPKMAKKWVKKQG